MERRSPDYVLGRIRAGILEHGTRVLLNEAGVGERMEADGLPHDGVKLCFDTAVAPLRLRRSRRARGDGLRPDRGHARPDGRPRRIRPDDRVRGRGRDAARLRRRASARDVPQATGRRTRSRATSSRAATASTASAAQSVPESAVSVFERVYPFGWLGVLVDQPPVAPELIYANHPRGFALCSMRSPTRSRYYIQCAAGTDVRAWSDDRFWDELRRRLPPDAAETLRDGREPREEHRAAAQLRRRADAVRPAVPGGRRRAHRAADRAPRASTSPSATSPTSRTRSASTTASGRARGSTATPRGRWRGCGRRSASPGG